MTEIQVGVGKEPIMMQLNMLNRHGLIAGATGTGKTVTLKVLAEQLSLAGVPVFLADIKGDLTNIAKEGALTDKLSQRLEKIGYKDFEPQAFPVRLWDVLGQAGHPVRATISEMGPLMLSRLLGLNDTQEGILNIVFKIADEKGWLLIDLKDLQAILKEVYDHASDYSAIYGNIAKQSVAAIQRSLLVLEQEGGDVFFGEPALELTDFIATDDKGQGMVNILNATKLFQSPTLYATFLMWMLAELYETLPEVGDLDKPKFVFFFDEVHLLFKDAPKAFVEKVEQMVRLIRSKGVGIFFITQNPLDLPESILAQLGNRVQHALRAYTPKEIKAVKTAAETFRQNPAIDTAEAITSLEVGEALISFLTPDAQPAVVERGFIIPPKSSFDVLSAMEIQVLINQSPLYDKYTEAVDRESAYEILAAKVADEAAQKAAEDKKKADEKAAKEAEKEERRRARKPKSEFEKARDTFVNSAIRTVSRELVRGILGSLRKR
ncbi:helicase HerA-like domain-containing protein [Streptococcus pluranimalium]|uniref:helicase HerA-like domain-containing protein n=1 Tax=Streptococcus pluranimalium TaxID=82348 RepID=UPI0039FBD579